MKPKLSHLHERDPHDWYIEPTEATAGLLAVERFIGSTWDPACGQGNICRTFSAAGLPVLGSDLVDRVGHHAPDWWVGMHDFMTDESEPFWPGVTNVVCNPPFYRAAGTEFFIRKALKHARGKVAIFTDVKFLASKKRAVGLFAEHCPHRVWTLAKRPSCPPGRWLAEGNSAGGGTADWCWLVWSKLEPPVNTYVGSWILPTAKVAA